MAVNRSLISPIQNPQLEKELRAKLRRHADGAGGMGELEPLAVRIGLMQNDAKPQFVDPQLLIFAADHGLAVDGLAPPSARSRTTSQLVHQLLTLQFPVSAFAQLHGMALSVVDSGIAESVPTQAGLLARKIAHGTRNARVGPAMSVEQAHAAIRAGMEIVDVLPGNVVACAGVGTGSHESAALVLSRLADLSVRGLLHSGPHMEPERLAHLLVVTQGAQGRHRDVADPVEVLAAFGGYEIAMMVGAMLVAASKRHLVMVDGLSACAALMVASRIAPSVADYCVFCRSHGHRGLDVALQLFRATALLELGMESIDGTGAVLAWPLVKSAAALLSGVAVDEGGADPTRPSVTVSGVTVNNVLTKPSPLGG